jgi:hypothetical protein
MHRTVKKNKVPPPQNVTRLLQGAFAGSLTHFNDKWQVERLMRVPACVPHGPDGFSELWPYLKNITALDPWRACSLAWRLWETRELDGDVIECGGLLGGMTVMMALLSARWGRPRRVFMLDAFQGLPTPDPVKDGFYEKGWGRVTRAQAEAVLWVAGVQKQVTVVEGWFEDTLPTLKGHQFCLAHLDGDLYGSTRVALEHVGPSMVEGGAVVLDDYADLGGGVMRALHEHVTRTGEQVVAGPVVQAFYRAGVLARDRNRDGVKEDLRTLQKDKQYQAALLQVAQWLKEDRVKVNALLGALQVGRTRTRG